MLKMDDDTTNLDQIDEVILAYAVSDDELEAAAGTEVRAGSEPASVVQLCVLNC